MAPFSQIARELTIMRELYELDLASRNPPIIRITESPSEGDTEVTYTGEQVKAKRTAATILFGEEEEEDDE